MVLTDSGSLYTFGSGSHGQLGHRSNKNALAPRQVLDLMNRTVSVIAAGWNHSLALTE
jgi:hypothetical protein